MRMSILNTATTEQMGYGIISFFVCFHTSVIKYPFSSSVFSIRSSVFSESASLGVDYISSGALTHSAPVLDISLKNLHAL